jgi:hypothetical protein
MFRFIPEIMWKNKRPGIAPQYRSFSTSGEGDGG